MVAGAGDGNASQETGVAVDKPKKAYFIAQVGKRKEDIMADKSFDVIIVGGGNKGLVAGMYLQKYGGLSVGIFEKRH